MSKNITSPNVKIKVWDFPVRLFHWGLAICFVASWASAELFDNAMQYHLYAGYAMLILILFRVLWGFMGSTTARFTSFIRGFGTTLKYAGTLHKPHPGQQIGHNPLGGWMVVVMLGILFAQAGTGLFSTDDVATQGPLAFWVGDTLSDTISGIHQQLFNFLLALIVLHISAVLFYRFFKHDNLISPMITGYKDLPGGTSAPALHFVSNRRAFLLFGLVTIGVLVPISIV
ncbi:cytochrome b/b6 domain-containing protein [Sulfuriferula sp. GW1]|uniref:cytochrome b/b6 domain-containing protein n=1 Tax=Sulfuriferula sp. GW1 TaxID=3345111 RepID=UPI0039AF3A65